MRSIARTVLPVVLLCTLTCRSVSEGGIPAPGNNKVAYYVFDSGGPDHYPLTSFTDSANVVVLFEGTLWELADSAHYNTGWMRNVNYHSYSEIIRDVRILQARGVKVLMNVDDAKSWSTSTPFTTYAGTSLTCEQFASFIKACAIDSLRLDGISLDIEHGATGNAEYIALLKAIGKYFGPQSPDSTATMYIAAIYSGGAPGYVVGKSREVAAYFNFVMDMAYFSSNYQRRFSQWADSIGASKTMVGVLNDYFDLAYATSVAAWQPAGLPKTGVMVYAANNSKAYTDAVFSALSGPTSVAMERDPAGMLDFELLQNWPNPFNPATSIGYSVGGLGSRQQAIGSRVVRLAVHDLLGREVAVLVDGEKQPGEYTATWDARGMASGVYYCRLLVGNRVQTRTMILMR